MLVVSKVVAKQEATRAVNERRAKPAVSKQALNTFICEDFYKTKLRCRALVPRDVYTLCSLSVRGAHVQGDEYEHR